MQTSILAIAFMVCALSHGWHVQASAQIQIGQFPEPDQISCKGKMEAQGSEETSLLQVEGEHKQADDTNEHVREGSDHTSYKEKTDVKGIEESSLLQISIGAHSQENVARELRSNDAFQRQAASKTENTNVSQATHSNTFQVGPRRPSPRDRRRDAIDSPMMNLQDYGVHVDHCDCDGCGPFGEFNYETWKDVKYGMVNAQQSCITYCMSDSDCKRVSLREDGCHLYGTAAKCFKDGGDGQKEFCWAKPGCQAQTVDDPQETDVCKTNAEVKALEDKLNQVFGRKCLQTSTRHK